MKKSEELLCFFESNEERLKTLKKLSFKGQDLLKFTAFSKHGSAKKQKVKSEI